METRRILRLERRRTHRSAVIAVVCTLLGVGVGMMLPHSTTASVVLLAAAAACLIVVLLRSETRAPLHGLHRVVRLPLLRAISAAFASLSARVVGSLRALSHLRPTPSPIVLDELDEDAAAWWGPTAARPPAASVPAPPVPAPSKSVPSVPVPPIAVPYVPAPYAPVDAASLSPVLAAPLPSARVSVSVTHRVRARVAQVRDSARQHMKGFTTKTRVRA